MSSGTGVELRVEAAPTPDDIAAIGCNLSAFNEEAALPYDKRPLAVFLRSADGRLLGGLTGYTNWSWLYVDCFWLTGTVRGGGWGSRMLQAAEDEAVRRGCRGSRLFTYSFQALGFYQRHGYEVFGTLDDYPPGHCQHWLRKTLGSTPGG